MTSTDIRQTSDTFRSISSIRALPIASLAATNNQALVYDSTTGYLTPQTVTFLDDDNTFTGNMTFEGGLQFDQNGDEMKEIQFQSVSVGTVGASGGLASQNVTFASQFNSVPRVFATVETAGTADSRMNVVVEGLTTIGCTVWVANQAGATSSVATVKLLIIEV